ncbi:MAG: M48 family metallopeptidase [Burkholderiales bacterium]
MTAPTFPAIRFDGRTALAQDVAVRIEGRTLAVTARGGIALECVRVDAACISERFANAPRIVALGRGVSLEVPDPDGAFDRALGEAGVAAGGVERMQRWWPASLAALVGLIGIIAFAYTRGVPAAAHWLAFRLPDGLEQRIGDEVLEQLDKYTFKPSALPAERRDALTRRFAAAAAQAAPDVGYRLEFRGIEGPGGVNAMALPGGTIVLLDGLVELAGNDDAVVGVAGHELGHVAGKHSLRQLLQSLGVGALAVVLWGDFSTVIANVPIAFGVLRYGRAFEREADDFAIALLAASGTPQQPLIDFFATMEKHAKTSGREAPPAFLSTHPATAERQQRLRDAAK